MAKTLTFTIADDTKATLLLNYFCRRYGYQEQVDNPDYDPAQAEDPVTNPSTIDNPETKLAFMKKMTIDWWRGEAYAGKMKELDSTARTDFEEGNITID